MRVWVRVCGCVGRSCVCIFACVAACVYLCGSVYGCVCMDACVFVLARACGCVVGSRVSAFVGECILVGVCRYACVGA